MNLSSIELVPRCMAAAAWTGVWAELGPLWLRLGSAWPLPALIFVGVQAALIHGAVGLVVGLVVRRRVREQGAGAALAVAGSTLTTLVVVLLLGSAAECLVAGAVGVFTLVLAALMLRLERGALRILLLPPLLLALSALGTTRWSGQGEGASVVVITVEGARADRYGISSVDTPAYDELARAGVVFTHAITASPDAQQGAAVALGVGGNTPPLAVKLAARKLTTAAFVSTRALGKPAGLDAGFDLYDDDLRWVRGLDATSAGRLFSLLVATPEQRRAGDTIDRALRWLQGRREPFMMWVHLHDPVAPFEPPIPWDERYTRGLDGRHPHATGMPPAAELEPHIAEWLTGVTDPLWVVGRYEGELAYTEHHVSRLLAALPDNTVVVMVGLSGTSLGDDGQGFSHHHLGAAALEVPAVLRAPGLPSEVRGEPVSIAELPRWVLAARAGQSPGAPTMPVRAQLRTGASCEARELRGTGWQEVGCEQPTAR